MKNRIKILNNRVGDLKGYDCNICKNKGYLYELQDNEIIAIDCQCKNERLIMSNLARAGLLESFKTKTLETFKTPLKWQMDIKNKALEYLKSQNNEWFVLCGITGSGKTHIATAISVELVKRGLSYHYMQFSVEMPSLATKINNFNTSVSENAQMELERLANVDVLYIDDFMKLNNYNKEVILPLLFTLINQRYINNKRTIITTELSVEEIMQYDEAITGRMIERAGSYVINRPKNDNREQERNYRLK